MDLSGNSFFLITLILPLNPKHLEIEYYQGKCESCWIAIWWIATEFSLIIIGTQLSEMWQMDTYPSINLARIIKTSSCLSTNHSLQSYYEEKQYLHKSLTWEYTSCTMHYKGNTNGRFLIVFLERWADFESILEKYWSE